MLDWNDLRYFIAVANGGSTLAAGRALRVSHTTVARRIAALEEALGIQLFDKRQAGYALTPAGEDLLEEARRVEASAAAFADAAAAHGRELKGTVRITSEDIYGTGVLAPVLRDLHDLHPEIMIDLDMVQEMRDLGKGEADIALRSSPKVEIETKWQGLTKGFFSGESLFLIRAVGQGDLWFNTYGAMIEIDVDGEYVVDTGNIVAFTEGLEYKVSKVGGYKSLFFSGEGFVCRFSGKGKIWIQTRGVQALLTWVHPYRPVKKRG